MWKKLKCIFIYIGDLEGKQEWNCWPLPYIFGSKDYAGSIMIKMIINTITQIRDKTANVTQIN